MIPIPMATATTNTVFSLPIKGKICHGLLGPEPHSIYDILKSKDASEEQSEYGGEHAAAGNDSCQTYLLKPVQQKSSNQQAQSLPGVP